jgi:hypothetical protein
MKHLRSLDKRNIIFSFHEGNNHHIPFIHDLIDRSMKILMISIEVKRTISELSHNVSR